jgi:hypothetical protein
MKVIAKDTKIIQNNRIKDMKAMKEAITEQQIENTLRLHEIV